MDKKVILFQGDSITDWLSDGVHRTSAGNELIKQEWLKAFALMK